jgi:hypothetical protein
MSAWWTYSISDFLLFSRETYFRLFERYHHDVWPLQIAALAAGIAILALVLSGKGGRTIAILLAIAWLWVAWAFHIRRFATIQWAATYYAAAFVIQSLLVLWTGAIRNRFDGQTRGRWPGLALIALAVAVPPFLPGRIELFALTPDPTALATIGVVLALGARPRTSLLVIPLLWCAVTCATLWSMRTPDALLPLLAPIAAIVLHWRAIGRHGRQH